MKLINMRCTNCGADLEIDPDRKQLFCSYCGTKLVLDDENVQITNRIVDEARLKEAEVRLRELEYEHERELREETIRLEQKKSFRISVIAYLCVLAAAYLLPETRSFFILFLIFGAVALSSMRTGDKRSMAGDWKDEYSPKSRIAALVLCIFLGGFGIHNFYVGKIGWGILYLFTFGLFGIGWLIDIIRIACGNFRDSQGRYLKV